MLNKFVVFVLGFLCDFSISDIHTSTSELEELFDTETILIKSLTQYIDAQQKKLNDLKRYTALYKNQYNTAIEDTEAFIDHPVNAFKLIRYLNIWEKIEEDIDSNPGKEFIKGLSRYDDLFKFPTNENLEGSINALIRLQQTYMLKISELAKGEINGVKAASELSSEDCFNIGSGYFWRDDYYQSILWGEEALRRFKNDSMESIKKELIYEYLAFSYFKLGDNKLAFNACTEVLKLDPTNKKAIRNQRVYSKRVSNMSKENIIQDIVSPYTQEEKIFKELCREELNIPNRISSKLKCKYVNNGNAFLKISPFKIEEIYTKPRILMYHDVISDEEMKIIKDIAKPLLANAAVHEDKEKHEFKTNRIKKIAFLDTVLDERINILNQRVQDMTGLSKKTSEDFQIANYGIGGYYMPHHDSNETHTIDLRYVTNRIATVQFYMSDIEVGGATIFPRIKIKISPRKGSALFWNNFKLNGERNLNTEYAECPVLLGSKWVMKKWFRKME